MADLINFSTPETF